MIDETIAILGASCLFVAGFLELACLIKTRKDLLWSSRLAAFGFFMLGMRYSYLIYTDDTERLHIIGTSSIVAIAVARIIWCAETLKGRL